MKARPILFNGPMVRALLAKSQTRRIVKCERLDFVAGVEADRDDPRNYGYECDDGFVKLRASTDPRDDEMQLPCPYGRVGDQLWVRETWGYTAQCDDINGPGDVIAYRAGGEHVYEDVAGKRRLRRIKDGRVMCPNHFCWPPKTWKPSIHMPRWASRITLEITNVRVERLNDISESDARAEGISKNQCPDWHAISDYRVLWESINGHGSWALNPFVWCISFRRVSA